MLKFLKVIVSGVVVAAGLVAGFVSSDHINATFEARTVSAECAVGGELPTASAVAVGNSIVITAPIMTADPCHTVVGTINALGDTITGSLSAQPTGEALCPQCVGLVIGEVIVPGLGPGFYAVKIDLPSGSFTAKVEIL